MKQIQRSDRVTEEGEREWNEKDSEVRDTEEQERQKKDRDRGVIETAEHKIHTS